MTLGVTTIGYEDLIPRNVCARSIHWTKSKFNVDLYSIHNDLVVSVFDRFDAAAAKSRGDEEFKVDTEVVEVGNSWWQLCYRRRRAAVFAVAAVRAATAARCTSRKGTATPTSLARH